MTPKFMTNQNAKTQAPEPIFPEESGLIIGKILEKYGLAAEQKKGLEKFMNSKTSQERIEFFENLPGRKMAKLVRDYAEGKVSLENLPLLLEKELNVSEKDAKEISKDLEKTLLVFIKQGPVEEKEMAPRTVPISEEEPEITIPEKPKIPSKKDIYREPID